MTPGDEKSSRRLDGQRRRGGKSQTKSSQGHTGRSSTQKSGVSGTKSGGAPRKYKKKKRANLSGDNFASETLPGNREWGGLARKGVLRVTHDDQRESEKREDGSLRDDNPTPEESVERQLREERRFARFLRNEELRAEAKTAVDRAKQKNGTPEPGREKRKTALNRRPLNRAHMNNEDEGEALLRSLGPLEGKKQLRKLKTAARSFEAERYIDASKSLESINTLAPAIPAVCELYGLTLYRLGNYREAAEQLEVFRKIAGSADQNPVLADCYRAQRRWADVEYLWSELAAISPSAELVNEGRIVMAGALSDQGKFDSAVRLLSKGWKPPTRPREHHLRRAYALADLYERSGDIPRARALFDWMLSKSPDFVDVRERLDALR